MAQVQLHLFAFKIYQNVVKQLSPIPGKYREELNVIYRILTQNRNDTNKLISVHEPQVLCISKDKEHKQYEFAIRAVLLSTEDKDYSRSYRN
jgi:transposase, IS5 family